MTTPTSANPTGLSGPLAYLFLVVLLGFTVPALAAPAETLHYANIGSGISNRIVVRTLFRLQNEDDHDVGGALDVSSSRGEALGAEFSSAWTGDPGSVTLLFDRVEFSVPSGSGLELTMEPSAQILAGRAGLSFSGGLKIQTLLQVAETPVIGAPGPEFEHYLESEAEIFPTQAVKDFAFPIFLFQGQKNVNTAFSIVSLSTVPGKVQLLLRPDSERTVTLQPGQLIADYFDRFWQVAFPEIFPFRFLGSAEIHSEVPLGVSVFRTLGGLPLSGVRIAQRSESEEVVSIQLNTQFDLTAVQTGRLDSAELTVRFWDIREDSRCPIDVNCIQAGQAKVVLRASNGGPETAELILSTAPGVDQVTFDGHSFKLVGVKPEPVSTRTLEMDDYVLTLLIRQE